MKQRLEAIDFGRGMSVLIMVVVHTLWMYGDHTTQADSWLGTLVHMLGKGTASFLVAMGVCLALSRSQDIAGAFKRGLILLAVGYLMNGLKFLLPIYWFNTMPADFIAAYGWQSPLTFAQARYLLLTGDILQMAGLAMWMVGIVRHFVTNKYQLLLVAVVVAFGCRLISGWRPDVEGLDHIADMFWGDQYNIYFPVFPWICCILVGLFFGMSYRENPADPQRLYRQMLFYGAGFTLVGGGLCIYDFDYHFADFFHLGPGGIIYLIGVNLVALWLVSRLLQRFKFQQLKPLINYCSRHVTSLYVIQWVLVCWGMGLVGFKQLNLTQTLLAMVVMLFLTLIVRRSFDWLVYLSRAELDPVKI